MQLVIKKKKFKELKEETKSLSRKDMTFSEQQVTNKKNKKDS